jgi:hypothetical protein
MYQDGAYPASYEIKKFTYGAHRLNVETIYHTCTSLSTQTCKQIFNMNCSSTRLFATQIIAPLHLTFNSTCIKTYIYGIILKGLIMRLNLCHQTGDMATAKTTHTAH